MKDVYQKTPQMGDPTSLEPKISETLGNIERLRLEIQKCEVRAGVGRASCPVIPLAVLAAPGPHSWCGWWHKAASHITVSCLSHQTIILRSSVYTVFFSSTSVPSFFALAPSQSSECYIYNKELLLLSKITAPDQLHAGGVGWGWGWERVCSAFNC